MSVTILTASSSRKFVRAWTSGCIGAASCSLGHGRASANARGQSDVVHCHLLFHLPVNTARARSLRQVEAAILVSSSGTVAASTDERVIKLGDPRQP